MKRDSDPGQRRHDAVFRSSRRVTFVLRSDLKPRRFTSSRVSRDAMESVQVDVEPDPSPAPRGLGLNDDWSDVAEALAETDRDLTGLRLWNREAGDALTARAVFRDRNAYVAAADVDADSDSELIELDRDLFDLVRTRRAVISIDLDGDTPTRLVSFESVRNLFDSAEPEDEVEIETSDEPDAAEKAAEQSSLAAVAPVVTEPESAPTPTAANLEEPPAQEHTQGETSSIDARKDKDAGGTVDGASRLRALTSPKGFPDSLQNALVGSLRPLAEAFSAALLFQVEYVDGHTEFLVGFSGADEERESELENSVNSALTTAPGHGFELGITFLESGDPMVVRISRVGLRLA